MIAGEQTIVTVEAGIARLTFDNAARHNALSLAMATSIVDALLAFEADPEVRVIVLSGAGDRAFMSGADLDEQDDPEISARLRPKITELYATLAAASKPVIAMIRGYCLGGGLAAALEADLRFAAQGSVFGIPAARLGIGYPVPGVARLVALVGPAVAADILYTARRLTAEEALATGFLQGLLPAEELEAHVTSVAASIAANAPLSLRAAKAAIRFATAPPGTGDREEVDRLIAACGSSADLTEGRQAFFERRAPRFTGA